MGGVNIKKVRAAVALFLILFLSLVILTPGCGREETSPAREEIAPADDWSMWVDGVSLRGANIYQRRVYPELDGPTFMGPGPLGPPYTQEDIAGLAAMGANYVEISHPGLYTESPPYILDEEVQENLDRLLNMIEQEGMHAVIAFRAGPGRSDFTFYWDDVGDWFDESYLDDSVWESSDAQDAWVEMWRYTAERYREHPAVVGYELMVEPNSNDRLLDIWDPQEFYNTYAGTLYDWNQLYPRIISAVRKVDEETPILVGGNGYSAVEWLPYLQPSGDPHTVYTVHQYSPHVYTHQDPGEEGLTYPGVFDVDYDGEEEVFDRAWLEDYLSIADEFSLQHGVPIAVTEFGAVRWAPGAAAFMEDNLTFFEGKGWNHALWAWNPSWEDYNHEVDQFDFTHGPDPDNHTAVPSSDLIEVIKHNWSLN